MPLGPWGASGLIDVDWGPLINSLMGVGVNNDGKKGVLISGH